MVSGTGGLVVVEEAAAASVVAAAIPAIAAHSQMTLHSMESKEVFHPDEDQLSLAIWVFYPCSPYSAFCWWSASYWRTAA